jgi:hypothetical protein
MRWMGKVAYRCRDCQRRFYVGIDVDKRLRRAAEWQRRAAEHAGKAHKDGRENDKEEEDPLEGYEKDLKA